MKILIVGATGTIGKAVAERLSEKHEVIGAGHRDGDYQVDLGSKASIEALFKKVGTVDAVISTAGAANFAPFNDLDDAAFDLALTNKLMGQINLVRLGRDHVSDAGSFTLTAGILSRHLHEDGSFHLVMDEDDEREVIAKGWGLHHPWKHRGVNEILVYAPRSDDEIEMLKPVITASYRFAIREHTIKMDHCCSA